MLFDAAFVKRVIISISVTGSQKYCLGKWLKTGEAGSHWEITGLQTLSSWGLWASLIAFRSLRFLIREMQMAIPTSEAFTGHQTQSI